MDKNQIIKTIKKKTRGIYSEKFYTDLADEILGVQKNNLIELYRTYNKWVDKLESDKKYYSDYIVFEFNMDNNTLYTPKRIMMIIREYCEFLGYVFEKGRDAKGRFFTITKYEPK